MLRFAIIGTGFMGETHADCFTSAEGVEGARLTAVVSRNPEKGAAFAAKYGIPWYEDYETMLKDDIADAVDICLPTFLHEPYVIRGAEEKKHIFCEKPVTLSRESLDRMLGAVEKAGVRFAVAQVVRFWSENRALARMVDRGELGTVKTVYASRLATHPVWSEWYADPKLSGGALFDLHLHDLDYLCHTFGDVDSVYAQGTQNERGSWNHVSSALRFSNGIRAVSESSLDMPPSYPLSTLLRICGERKSVEYRMSAGINLEDLDGARRQTVEYGSDGSPRILEIPVADAYREELAYFTDCVNKNRPLKMLSVESIQRVFGVLLAIKESLETGKVVSL
jgi:predicted dehydrogenase